MALRLAIRQARALGVLPAMNQRPPKAFRALGTPAPASLPGRWTVVIPNWHPTGLNELLCLHWAARRRRKRSDADLIAVYCGRAQVAAASRRRRITQRLTLAGNDRRRDDDNAWKSLLDSLVYARVLVDDGPDWVEKRPLEFERGRERKTTLVIEDLVE